jgi:hypothetical protein
VAEGNFLHLRVKVSRLFRFADSQVSLAFQWFPYDFRGEEIMSLVKHIVSRCEANVRLGDEMSEMLSALLAKLTDLSQHEEEMKAFKKPPDEVSSWRCPEAIARPHFSFVLLAASSRRMAEHSSAGRAAVLHREAIR